MLISWVCSQPFARSARTSLAKIDLKSSVESGPHAEKKPLHYSPCNGRSYFWHKRRLFVFNRQRTLGEFGGTREEAYISYFGRNPAVLRELLNECRRFYLESIENKTCVFEHQGDRWKASRSMAKREMSTVIINRYRTASARTSYGEIPICRPGSPRIRHLEETPSQPVPIRVLLIPSSQTGPKRNHFQHIIWRLIDSAC